MIFFVKNSQIILFILHGYILIAPLLSHSIIHLNSSNESKIVNK